MSNLQIESVAVYPLDVPLLAPFTIASAQLTHVNNIVIEIRLGNGIRGFGEGAVLPPVTLETQETALAVAKQQIEYLVGMEPGSWRRVGLELAERIPDYASVRAAIEIAFLDALTQSWGIPLAHFFGGMSNRLTTDITIPICTVSEAESLARMYKTQGFSTIKTKVGLELSNDLDRLSAICRGHPDCHLILDANEGYTVEQSLHLLDLLKKSKIPVALLEQPVIRDDWDGMCQITRQADVPVVADESCRSSLDAMRIVKSRVADVINIKIAKCGVVQALEIAAIARSGGVDLMIGEMVETRLATGFSAHFAAGLGGFSWVDLDTPLLLADDPIAGGYLREGANYFLDGIETGHGGKPVLK